MGFNFREAAKGPQLDFEHEEHYNGGSKRPDTHTLHGMHPDTGAEVGWLKYDVPRRKADKIYVQRLEVHPEHRGNGYASQLMDEMQQRHPGTPIDHGDRTDDGQGWWDSYTEGKPVRKGRTIAALEEDDDAGSIDRRGSDLAQATGPEEPEGAVGVDAPASCSYCGSTAFKDFTDNGRVRQATCAVCGGTMSAHEGAQWTPELIGDPSNHPKPDADPRSGGVGGAAAAGFDPLVRDQSRIGVWHLATPEDDEGVKAKGLPLLHPSDTHEERVAKLASHYQHLSNRLSDENAYDEGDHPLNGHHEEHGVPYFAHEAQLNENPTIRANVAAYASRHFQNHPPKHLPTFDIEGSDHPHMGEGTLAYHSGSENRIAVNRALAMHPEREVSSEDGNRTWFSNSGSSPLLERTMTHEIGHMRDHQMHNGDENGYEGGEHRAKMFKELSKHIPDATPFNMPFANGANAHQWVKENREHIINHIGTYAATNDHELIAELYAEHHHSSNPSKAAQVVGAHLDGEGLHHDHGDSDKGKAGALAARTSAEGTDARGTGSRRQGAATAQSVGRSSRLTRLTAAHQLLPVHENPDETLTTPTKRVGFAGYVEAEPTNFGNHNDDPDWEDEQPVGSHAGVHEFRGYSGRENNFAHWHEKGEIGPVPLRGVNVYATQSRVTNHGVNTYLENPEHKSRSGYPNYPANDRPIFVKHEGNYYTLDGHHRTAAAMLRGDDHVEGHVYDADKHGFPKPEWSPSQYDRLPKELNKYSSLAGAALGCKFDADDEAEAFQHELDHHDDGFCSAPRGIGRTAKLTDPETEVSRHSESRRNSKEAAVDGPDWCTWRHAAQCTFPNDRNNTLLAIPQVRGACPWNTRYAQQICPISEPGPQALMQAKGSKTAALSWDDIGDRHPHVYGDSEIHGDAADGADGPGIGDAANYLAHERPGHLNAEDSSVHDLEFHERTVHPRHIDYSPSGSDDPRVRRARQGYQQHPDQMPPLVLVKRHNVYHVADGHHRAEAAHGLDMPVRAYVADSPHPNAPFSDGEKGASWGAEPIPKERKKSRMPKNNDDPNQLKLFGSSNEDDSWKNPHRAPGGEPDDVSAPLHDVSSMLPDFYEHPEWHDHGQEDFHTSAHVIRSARDQPEKKIRVYRALPAEHAHKGIQTGDWVTTSKEYARTHGRHHEDSKHDWPVISTMVPAKHLHTEGDVHEWGYNGPPKVGMVAFKGGYHQEVRQGDEGVVPVKRRPKKEAAMEPLSVSQSYELARVARQDPEMVFHVTAAWSDVRNKAKRIRAEGKVMIKAATNEGLAGMVEGDHGTYENMITYRPGTRKIADWSCNCKWGEWAWDRIRFHGRQCSHSLALQYEAQSRGMFGREVHLGALTFGGSETVDEWAGLTDRPISAIARTLIENDEDPGDIMKLLMAYGLPHSGALQVLAEEQEHRRKCPFCGGGLSEKAIEAHKCPHCGHPIGHTGAAHESPTYLRFGHWPKDERSHNNVTGFKEEGVSVYDLDHHGEPKDPDPDFSRGHHHDEWCEPDCDLDSDNDDYGNDVLEEMHGRVHRAEQNRRSGVDRPSETGHLVKGEMVGIGHDGEPLLRNVKRVGDWIDHRHLLIPGAEKHHLAREPYDEEYEHPEGHHHTGSANMTEAEENERRKKHHHTVDTRRHAPNFGYGVPGWIPLPIGNCSQCQGWGCGHCGGTGQVAQDGYGHDANAVPDQNGDEGQMMQGGISDTSSLRTAKDSKQDGPSCSGVALKAADTGRVLMLQRGLGENHPAAGRWEWPGGHHEPGDTTSLHAGIREWEEEVGQPFPEGGTVHHTWTSPDGVYQGHVVVIPSEKDLRMHEGRVVPNPDDPKGDEHEQAAWWDINHAKGNKVLRDEVRKHTPWNEIAKAGEQKTASAWDPLGGEDDQPGFPYAAPLHSNSKNPGSTGFATSEDPKDWSSQEQIPDHLLPASSYDSFGYYGTLHDHPEPALPSTDGAEDSEEKSLGWIPPGSGYRPPETQGSISDIDSSLAPNQYTGSVDDIVRQFQATAGAKGIMAQTPAQKPGGGDVSFDFAAAARQYLAQDKGLQKAALKDFNFVEQQELINEGKADGARARNFSNLQIEGTHYENLAHALGIQDEEAEDLFS